MPRRKLASFAPTQYYRSLLHDINVDCVIDVGANEGHFAEFLRHNVGYNGPIVSFEPVSQVYSKLRSKSIEDPRWEVVQAALGERSGNVTVNIAASSVFSSILEASSNELFNSLSRQVGQEQVPIYRLDSFAPKFSQFKRIFLKTDTQGFDLSVLHGAKGLLNQIDCIQVELSFEPLYHDMPTWRDVLLELEARERQRSGIANLRVQFGRPVSSFQAMKHKQADMLVDVELARSAAYQAAQAAADDRADLPALASLAKASASEAYLQTAIHTIQIHGGIGFTWENDTHLWFKRAKSSEVLLGDPTWHREQMMRAWANYGSEVQ